MTTINNLSSVDAFTGGDQIPIWSSSNSDARRGSLSLLLTYIQDNIILSVESNRKQIVTYASTITLDLDTYDTFDILLIGNAIVNFVGGTNLQKILLKIKQDSTGSRLITWGSMIRFGTDLSSITLTTIANKIDYVGFINNTVDTKVEAVSLARGY